MLKYDAAGITEPEEGIIEFEILPEYLKILRFLQLKWEDSSGLWGSLQTNPHRPYGTKNLINDINTILETGSSLDEATCKKLHYGAAMALQICLKTGKFKAAKFRASKYGQDWKEYNDKLRKKKANPSFFDEEASSE